MSFKGTRYLRLQERKEMALSTALNIPSSSSDHHGRRLPWMLPWFCRRFSPFFFLCVICFLNRRGIYMPNKNSERNSHSLANRTRALPSSWSWLRWRPAGEAWLDGTLRPLRAHLPAPELVDQSLDIGRPFCRKPDMNKACFDIGRPVGENWSTSSDLNQERSQIGRSDEKRWSTSSDLINKKNPHWSTIRV